MLHTIKVVWICHFTDLEIQKILKPWKPKNQFAPWISNTISLLENRREIELHIVAPHEYVSGVKEFERNGVFYHFFNPFIPVWGRHWPGFFRWDIWTQYAKSKRTVRMLVEKINPDVIHLQGAENIYYSIAVLQFFGKYPVVLNFQRFAPEILFNNENENKLRERIELEIWKRAQYVSVRTKIMDDGIRRINPKANVFWVTYGLPEIKPIETQKIYDLVMFARLEKIKGIEDLIQIVALLRNQGEELKTCIVGPASSKYLRFLKKMTQSLNVNHLFTWKGALPTLHDVHTEASRAKISVLPVYKDVIPGTIIESMQLGLPVVSYKAGSIPDLNEDRENVLLSEIGDKKGIAKDIIRLISNEELYAEMSSRGIECIKKRYSNPNVIKQHIDCYKAVAKDFKLKGSK